MFTKMDQQPLVTITYSPLLEDLRAYIENVVRTRPEFPKPDATVSLEMKSSPDWCHIVLDEHDNRPYAEPRTIGYIALNNLSNKTLGNVQRGELFKTNANGPAKTARGSIYDKSTWPRCVSQWGSIR